mgnify:CR=1 FL=1
MRRRLYAPPRPAPKCQSCGATIARKPGPGRPPARCAGCKAIKPGPQWEVDPAGLERVQRHFGLKHPIHVKRSSGRIREGTYYHLQLGCVISKKLDPLQLYHVITISGQLSPADASRVILHEACHAHQNEREDGAMARYARDMRRIGPRRTREAFQAYRNHPLEVEARAAERHAADLRPARAIVRAGR